MTQDLLTKISILQQDIENIEKITKEHISSIKEDKYELLDKTAIKLHDKYNAICNAIRGSISIEFEYQNTNYKLAICNTEDYNDFTKKIKYAYVSQTGYSPTEIMIATDLEGTFFKYSNKYSCESYAKMYGLIEEKTSGRAYRVFYIKMLADCELEIDRLLEKAIEEKFQKESLEQRNKISKELSLLKSLSNYNN